MRSAIAIIALLVSAASLHAQATASSTTQAQGDTSAQPLYLANRAPLAPAHFLKLPIGSTTPRGWLRTQLDLEAAGMTGHLEELSHFCKFDGNAWVSPDGSGANGWEEVPYWLKGYGDLGYVLKNDAITKNARRWIDGVLSSQQPDGYFGPQANKTSLDKPETGGDGYPDLWPHMVMLNVLQSFYEATGDPRVLPFMTHYYQWLNTLPSADFARGYWPKMRWGDAIDSAYWLYDRTGDPMLLEVAKKIHTNMQDWSTGIHNAHNVNIAQAFREPTLFSQQALDTQLLHAAERNYHQVVDTYGQFPGGGFAADENYRPNFTDPHQGFETCGMVEFMHSFEILTRITGDPAWSDRCEDIAFNSLPAALTPDLKALHYLTCPNQVQLDRANHSPGIQNRGTMFAYSPGEVYRCCQHNVGQAWPYFTEEMWLATPDRGLCASLYAPSQVTAKVADGQSVTITEDTQYPFNASINFRITTPQPVTFPLYLRIPAWSGAPAITLNGKPAAGANTGSPGAYAIINRQWKSGDTISLNLPTRITLKTWPKNKNAVSVSYGPLSFSLKIGERWQRYGGSDAFPESEVFPTTPWNYGLVAIDDPSAFEIVRKPIPNGANPFTPDNAPIALHTGAMKIPNWKLDSHGLVAALQPSPIKSDQPLEEITLIPMGAARLRISMFPAISNGPTAHDWPAN